MTTIYPLTRSNSTFELREGRRRSAEALVSARRERPIVARTAGTLGRQRWSAARATRTPPAITLAPVSTEIPIFVADVGFVWSERRVLRDRCSVARSTIPLGPRPCGRLRNSRHAAAPCAGGTI